LSWQRPARYTALTADIGKIAGILDRADDVVAVVDEGGDAVGFVEVVLQTT
jgi:hypothetical protein